jgi:rhodanese-related sulfurtransferase
MGETGAFSMSPQEIYSRLGKASGPLLIDVRDPADFEADGVLIAGAIRRPPADAYAWASDLPKDRRPVLWFSIVGMVLQTARH